MELCETIDVFIHQHILENDPDHLLEAPLVGFSAASDPRYGELKTIIGPWHQLPQDYLPTAQSVISFFVPFSDRVTDAARQSTNVASLWGKAYIHLNALLGETGEALCDFLRTFGYDAEPVPATHNFDAVTLQSGWSHRSAACIAGLGSFGLNRMLITEKGSSGRFCTVFTSAVLPPSASPAPDYCYYYTKGTCQNCIRHCPTQALSTDGFDKDRCYGKLLENAEILKAIGYCDVCGRCIAVCPLASR